MSQRHPRDPYQADTGPEMARCAEDYGFEPKGGTKHMKYVKPGKLLIIPRGQLSKGVKLALAAAILGKLLLMVLA